MNDTTGVQINDGAYQQVVKPISTQDTQLKLFDLSIAPVSSHLYKMNISTVPFLVQSLWSKTIELFRHDNVDGFDKSTVPATYVSEVFKGEIRSKIKSYLITHLVPDYFFNELINRKIPIANDPRLTFIEYPSDDQIIYHFDVSTADVLELKEWKLFAFRSPKRKRYKDLDKQVQAFFDSKSPTTTNPIVEEGDWVMFQAIPVDEQDLPISPYLASDFWIFIQHQELIEPFVAELTGKPLDSNFYTKTIDLYQNAIKSEHHCYRYNIAIKAIVKGSQFSLDTFKLTFKLKNKLEVHNKLMEVFSYRNDLSQRKSIIEEVFHLLLSKHRFEIPKHLVLRREENLIDTLTHQPDYHVYKAQKDFTHYIEMLAEKQLKEEIVIDQIALQDNIRVDTKDIQQYLHLLSNKRLQEFVYFKPFFNRFDQVDIPINVSAISRVIMREKTLNYIIYTLTR